MKHLDSMKKLADAGDGLSNYKNVHRDIHDNFSVHYRLIGGHYKKLNANQGF
jgi:hypothetical protein